MSCERPLEAAGGKRPLFERPYPAPGYASVGYERACEQQTAKDVDRVGGIECRGSRQSISPPQVSLVAWSGAAKVSQVAPMVNII